MSWILAHAGKTAGQAHVSPRNKEAETKRQILFARMKTVLWSAVTVQLTPGAKTYFTLWPGKRGYVLKLFVTIRYKSATGKLTRTNVTSPKEVQSPESSVLVNVVVCMLCRMTALNLYGNKF